AEGPISSKPWGTEKLQKYLCYVRDTYTSLQLTRDAEVVVAKYYQSQRSADNRSAARTTVRLLESLIRLAQAHARLMCRTEVTLQDALVSVICVETSLHSTAQLGMESVLHSDFPPNPDEEFEIQQGLILDRLGLSNLHHPRDKSQPQQPPPPPFNSQDGSVNGNRWAEFGAAAASQRSRSKRPLDTTTQGGVIGRQEGVVVGGVCNGDGGGGGRDDGQGRGEE
ncbi:unnamed protein product, partial [Sphacelaria rigidula]